MLVSESSSPYICCPLSPFILLQLWLVPLINFLPFLALSLLLCLPLQPDEPTVTGATIIRAGGSAGGTGGMATEREATTEQSQARATATPTSEPKKKKWHPLSFSPLLPVAVCLSLSCRPFSPKHYTTLQPKTLYPAPPTALPALHCPVLSSTRGSLSQPVSLSTLRPAKALPGVTGTMTNPFVLFLLSFLCCLNPSVSHLPSNMTQKLSLRVQRWSETWGYCWNKKKRTNLWDQHWTFSREKWFSTNCK